MLPLLIALSVVFVSLGVAKGGVDAVPLWLWILIGVTVTVIAGFAIHLLVKQIRREELQLQTAEEAAERQREIDAQKLADLKTVTPLATLLELNQSQIDEYHRIATDQADRSFRSSQRAMALGLLVIVGCFAAGLYFSNGQTKVFVAAIAGVAAALSAFLNRTYLQMYGQTLSQLNRYFEQPVLTGYYLTAERLAQDLGEDPESEMRRRIIDQVLEASARMNNGTTGEEPPSPAKRPKKKRAATTG
ncbi:TRADD-N-associated membrane domain-containing protein [Streptomyces sp. NPDC001273]|uniref:TRADD-N-associated membrane domain-containing protein n=1 Tax=unclassified Streptomyces TaxID=2593676 RepID=UPI0033E4B7B3